MKNLKQAHHEGQQYVGKYAKSRLLTELTGNGRQILQAAQKITGYEIVETFGEATVMVFIGGESIFADTLINIHTPMFALIEGHGIHTSNLTEDEANEMMQRHISCFPDIHWAIVPMIETKNMERLKGLMEKQRDIAVKNSRI